MRTRCQATIIVDQRTTALFLSNALTTTAELAPSHRCVSSLPCVLLLAFGAYTTVLRTFCVLLLLSRPLVVLRGSN